MTPERRAELNRILAGEARVPQGMVCRHCGGPLPLRERLRRGRVMEYCRPACRVAACKKRRREERENGG